MVHKKECDTRINEMSEFLANDKCSDFNEYKKMTGKIRGVRMSLEIIDDLITRYDNDEEEGDEEDGK